MNVIRQTIKRTGNKIIIELPEEFKEEVFEFILLPLESNTNAEYNVKDEITELSNFSISNLDLMYSNEEPDYTNVLVKEPNGKYNT